MGWVDAYLFFSQIVYFPDKLFQAMSLDKAAFGKLTNESLMKWQVEKLLPAHSIGVFLFSDD